MKQLEHSKILNKIAKEAFTSYGIKRKGRSRTWLDDQGWFVTLIEFQPSGFDRGTYLNVGVSFNWYLKGYFTFNIGHRESEFVAFIDEEQFSIEVKRLIQIALKKVLLYRKECMTIEAAKAFIIANKAEDSLWGNYEKGVVCALANDKTQAEKYFQGLLKIEHDVEWANELKHEVQNLIKLLDNLDDFKKMISEIIQSTRKLRKLPEMEIKI